MKVLRVYHSGRDATHRERDRALVAAGADLTLLVPAQWPGPDDVGDEPFEILQLAVTRPGDINRHVYADPSRLTAEIARIRPDVIDLHEEPFSAVTHQVLRCADRSQTFVGYTAQNIDKRFPPPFSHWQRTAFRRWSGLYPCSRQAASVAVRHGFGGALEVLPLAAPAAMTPGDQRLAGPAMLLVGRMVPEKGVVDAVRLLSRLRTTGASLHLVGTGPEVERAVSLAHGLGVGERLQVTPWLDAAQLAACYRAADIVLAPSRSTRSWVEQFGRMVVEAQASGAVVVAYDSGSLPEVVGEAGLVVPEGDEESLYAAVSGLVADRARWSELRERGLQAAEARTWGAVARAQFALYEQALDQPQHPGGRTRSTSWGEPALGGARPLALPRIGPAVRSALGERLMRSRDVLGPRLRAFDEGTRGR